MRNYSGHISHNLVYITPYESLEEEIILGRMEMAEEPLSEEESFSTEPPTRGYAGQPQQLASNLGLDGLSCTQLTPIH